MRCDYASKTIGSVSIELILIGGKSSGVVAGTACIRKFFGSGAFQDFSSKGRSNGSGSVSYTHLDVYKRQNIHCGGKVYRKS